MAQTGFGTVVQPGDAAAITRALRTIQADPPDRVAGAARAHQAFSVASVLDGYEILLDKAVHQRRVRD